MSKTVDLGPVSAYALAVKHGYIGTESEWVTEMENKRNDAVASAASAAASETSSVNSAIASANSASIAASHEVASANSAVKSESYAVGGTGIRQNEDADNAAYYYDQVKRISQGLQGGLLPMGTVTFTQLSSTTAQSGYMYNVSDDFVTDDTFNEGAGHDYPAGTNVYWTADGMWDCFAGTAVGGVKGERENTYRQGLVNLTSENIGALPEDGDSKGLTTSFTSNDSGSATEWTAVAPLSSGEKHASIFNKVSTMFKNVRYLYKMLNTTNIASTAPGTHCYMSNGIVHFVANASSAYNLLAGWNTIGSIPSEFAPKSEQRRPCLVTRGGGVGDLSILRTGTIRVYSSVPTVEEALFGEVNYIL